MPSLYEEDPEYPAKVAAYLVKHGLKVLPWGFIVANGQLVAVSTVRERRQHAAGVSILDPVANAAETGEPPILEAPIETGPTSTPEAA